MQARRAWRRKIGGEWQVHQWLKKAVLLSFRLNDMTVIAGGPGGAVWWDKVAVQIRGLGRKRFTRRRLPRGAELRSCAAAPISRRASS